MADFFRTLYVRTVAWLAHPAANVSDSTTGPRGAIPGVAYLLILSAVVLMAGVLSATYLLVSNFHDRAFDISRRDLRNTASVLAEQFDRGLDDPLPRLVAPRISACRRATQFLRFRHRPLTVIRTIFYLTQIFQLE